MATIGENSEAVYPLLVDAMLRVGDAKSALDTIAEMPEAWPDDESRMRRVATAQAMLGQFEPAMAALADLLERRRDDQDLLFLAIQVMYRQHQAKALPAAEGARFDAYSKRYLDAKGPESALVQTWRKFVLR
jgi:predicted TPR repeat methyltransferase